MRESLPAPLAAGHRWARGRPWLRRFTLANRLLLAMAFVPTGLVKLTGNRFTLLPVDNPVGFFFEAMYRTGPYWRFIGLVQVAAAVLLLVPRTATLGAMLFLPIGLSIVLITWGVGFGGTVFVALGMLLSVTYLLCWDGDRIWAAGARLVGAYESPGPPSGMHRLEASGWILGALAGLGLVMTTRGYVPTHVRGELLLTGVGAGALVVAGWIAVAWRGR